jgi:uncharacterized protein (TIGR03000 family)
MKRACVILTLAVLAMLAAANEASAQIRIGAGRWGVYVGPGYYPSYYYPGYYYPSYSWRSYYYPPTYVEPVQVVPSGVNRSYYVDPTTANLTVLVPRADAQVWLNDTLMTQQGMDRLFQTPPLQRTGTYIVKARWTDNGKTIDQQRTVEVSPGQAVIVDFRRNPVETAPAPKASD